MGLRTDPFWKRLRAARAKIEAVTTDMSAAYTLAVRENLPTATHVFDRFHVVKLFNEQLSELRRELHREAATKLDRQILKGTRWLFLKNPDNLDESRNGRARLEERPGSTMPVFVRQPHFPVFPVFQGASYVRRKELLLTHLIRERLYDSACLLTSTRATGPKGRFRSPSAELTFEPFAASFLGREIAFATSLS